jgi:hypothetical protein
MRIHLVSPDAWCWQCPCGARAELAYGLCRKCQARAAWRRRVMRPRRARRIFRTVTK